MCGAKTFFSDVVITFSVKWLRCAFAWFQVEQVNWRRIFIRFVRVHAVIESRKRKTEAIRLVFLTIQWIIMARERVFAIFNSVSIIEKTSEITNETRQPKNPAKRTCKRIIQLPVGYKLAFIGIEMYVYTHRLSLLTFQPWCSRNHSCQSNWCRIFLIAFDFSGMITRHVRHESSLFLDLSLHNFTDTSSTSYT